VGEITQRRSVTILGSTGSIGTQALDVIERMTDAFSVHAITANTAVEAIAEQVTRFSPKRVAMTDGKAAAALRELVSSSVDVLEGRAGLIELAKDPQADVVLNAVVGAAGLEATLASLEAGIRVALANKESCVAGGQLVRRRIAAAVSYKQQTLPTTERV
jgi:1-deoxy-D-xylulose-5-phosphate reductoisomerase